MEGSSVEFKLNIILDKNLSNILNKPLKIPAISHALLSRAKGNPRAILKEAIYFRKNAKPIQKFLSKKSGAFGAAFFPDPTGTSFSFAQYSARQPWESMRELDLG